METSLPTPLQAMMPKTTSGARKAVTASKDLGGGTDWLIFTDDITPDRLGYFPSGDDLLVKIDGSSEDMVTIQGLVQG